MLELFKKNHWLYSILLLPYSMLLHVYGFLYANLFDVELGSLSFQYAFGWLYGNSGFEMFLSSIFVFFQAVLINRLIINNRMSSNSSLIPGLFYVTLCSFNREMLMFSPALIAMSFVLLSFVELNKIYIRRPVPVALYNFGIWAGLAFLIYPPLIVLLVVGVLSIQILRGLRLIEVFQMFGGLLTVLFLGSTLLYFLGLFGDFWRDLYSLNPSYIYTLLVENWSDQIIYIFLFLLIVITILAVPKINSNIGIKERKKWQIILFFWIASFIAIIFQDHQLWQHYHLIILPIAMIVGVSVGKMKQNIILEAFLLLMLVSIVFLHFHTV